MLIPRVIPCLLLADSGLVKTRNFASPKYVGDPINAVRIFNEKEVDELILLDIEASHRHHGPNFERIQDIVNEAFMPVAYGGGVTSVADAQRLIALGVEKIVLNKALLAGYELLGAMAATLGSQAVVVAVNVKRDWLGRRRVYDAVERKPTDVNPLDHVRAAVQNGAGEVLINDAGRDGTGQGYDLDLVREVVAAVNVPVIACGGASTLAHLREAVQAGASAVAAGSMFVYLGRHRAVMINYPQPKVLAETFKDV